MSRTILYGKVGRSVPLTLEKSSSLGGDNEFIATLKVLAERHPDDQFVIIGRNSGEHPQDVGLPNNVFNPWKASEIGSALKKQIIDAYLRKPNLNVTDQLRLAAVIDGYTMPYFDAADEVIMWAGQHGTTSTPIPSVKDRSILTKPQDSSALYGGFLLRGINAWRSAHYRHEEIWLNADPRNYLKMRDLMWPLAHPVLCQYNFTNNIKHERYQLAGDDFVPLSSRELGVTYEDGVWKAQVRNEYARLEINGMLPGTALGDMLKFNDRWADRKRFGIIVNETRVAGVREVDGRKVALRDWVLPLNPDFIHGTWSQDSRIELGINPTPLSYTDYVPTLQSVRSTFTTPASGSGWATAKPWEAFAAGTVCFFHPKYDDQNHILADAPDWLGRYLRVTSPSELRSKVNEVNEDVSWWHQVVEAQRLHFDAAVREPLFIKKIEERIYG